MPPSIAPVCPPGSSPARCSPALAGPVALCKLLGFWETDPSLQGPQSLPQRPGPVEAIAARPPTTAQSPPSKAPPSPPHNQPLLSALNALGPRLVRRCSSHPVGGPPVDTPLAPPTIGVEEAVWLAQRRLKTSSALQIGPHPPSLRAGQRAGRSLALLCVDRRVTSARAHLRSVSFDIGRATRYGRNNLNPLLTPSRNKISEAGFQIKAIPTRQIWQWRTPPLPGASKTHFTAQISATPEYLRKVPERGENRRHQEVKTSDAVIEARNLEVN
ncbi:hypothetical protein ACJZ2D_007751 [Fusarium nematophilum]